LFIHSGKTSKDIFTPPQIIFDYLLVFVYLLFNLTFNIIKFNDLIKKSGCICCSIEKALKTIFLGLLFLLENNLNQNN